MGGHPLERGKLWEHSWSKSEVLQQPPWRVQLGTASLSDVFLTQASFLGLSLCLRFTELWVGLVSSSADMVCPEPKQRGAPALMCLPRIQEKWMESLLIIKSYGFESKATTIAKLDQSLWTELLSKCVSKKKLCYKLFLWNVPVLNEYLGCSSWKPPSSEKKCFHFLDFSLSAFLTVKMTNFHG